MRAQGVFLLVHSNCFQREYNYIHILSDISHTYTVSCSSARIYNIIVRQHQVGVPVLLRGHTLLHTGKV